eukprot:12589-Heterococcus_DN1.PRE.2
MPVSYSSGLHTHEMHHIPHATICTAFMPSAKLPSSPAFARKTRSGVAVHHSTAHRAVSMSAVREVRCFECVQQLVARNCKSDPPKFAILGCRSASGQSVAMRSRSL